MVDESVLAFRPRALDRLPGRERAIFDWCRALSTTWSNALLVGPRRETRAMFDVVRPYLREPLFQWPRDGEPWCLHVPPRTLLVKGADLLDDDSQERLYRWLHDAGHDAQVLSFSETPLLQLVSGGAFCRDLYYCLNTIHVDCADMPNDDVTHARDVYQRDALAGASRSSNR